MASDVVDLIMVMDTDISMSILFKCVAQSVLYTRTSVELLRALAAVVGLLGYRPFGIKRIRCETMLNLIFFVYCLVLFGEL